MGWASWWKPSMNFLMFSCTKVWWEIWWTHPADSSLSGISPRSSSQATSRKDARLASSSIG